MEETTTLSFMEVWKGVILKCDLFTGENVHQISIHLNIEYRKIYLITTLWSHPNTGNSGFCDFVHSCSPPQKKTTLKHRGWCIHSKDTSRPWP